MSSISGRTKHSGQVLGLDPSAQSTTIIHYRKPLCHSRLELKQCVKQKEWKYKALLRSGDKQESVLFVLSSYYTIATPFCIYNTCVHVS